MSFAFDAWLVSFLLGRVAGKGFEGLLKVLKRDPVVAAIEEAIGDWADDLPEDAQVRPETLFRAVGAGSLEGEGSRQRLAQGLKDHDLPDKEIILGAFLEQYRDVQSWLDAEGVASDGQQAFFTLEEAQAQGHLESLAKEVRDAWTEDSTGAVIRAGASDDGPRARRGRSRFALERGGTESGSS